MPPIYITFLNRLDIEELALGDEEILAAIETSLAAQGRGQTVIEPRVHLAPGQSNGHFNVLCGAIYSPVDRAGIKVAGHADGRAVRGGRPDRAGRTAGRPARQALLSAPADAFVADFVGADRALRSLTLTTAGQAATPTPAGTDAPVVSAATSLRDVLSLLGRGVDAGGTFLGAVSLAAIPQHAATRKEVTG